MTITMTGGALPPAASPVPNPFHIPELAGRSLRPLAPWRYPVHNDYYADVDNTELSFATFAAYLPDPLADLDYRGRMVVVAGQSGSGKTSLIHRCVAEMQRLMTGRGLCAVVDLSSRRPMPVTRDNRTEVASVDEFLNDLAEQVRAHLAVKYEDFRDDDPVIRPAVTTYTRISAQLQRAGGVLAIILPRLEDAVNAPPPNSGAAAYHPVQRYMELRFERIIFFAESLDPEGVRHWHDHISGMGDREDALLLEVGSLDERDGWTFAEDRISRCTHPEVPTVEESTMLDVVSNHSPMSLSRLQDICHSVWENVIIQRPGTSIVTPDDFARYYTDNSTRFRARNPLPRNGKP
jgi:hypothetical protein